MRWTALAFPILAGVLLSQEPAVRAPGKKAEMKKAAAEFVEKMGRGEGKLRPGEAAVDFDLAFAGAKKGRVQLAKFLGKRPVALVFGSFT